MPRHFRAHGFIQIEPPRPPQLPIIRLTHRNHLTNRTTTPSTAYQNKAFSPTTYTAELQNSAMNASRLVAGSVINSAKYAITAATTRFPVNRLTGITLPLNIFLDRFRVLTDHPVLLFIIQFPSMLQTQ